MGAKTLENIMAGFPTLSPRVRQAEKAGPSARTKVLGSGWQF
jgi:hypothetical protein